MNKILISWNIVLTALVALLLWKGKTNNSNTSNASMPEMTVSADSLPKSSIVFINTDSLMSHYDMASDIKKELEKEKNAKEAAFQSKMQAFEQQVNNFKEIAQRLSPEEAQRQQIELVQKEQKLTEYRDQLTQELLKKEQDKTIMIQQNLQSYIKMLNANGQYTYVLGYAQGGGILYANTKYDITSQVINGLNQNYKASK